MHNISINESSPRLLHGKGGNRFKVGLTLFLTFVLFGSYSLGMAKAAPFDPSRDNLSFATTIAVDSTGVYITDTSNNRVLFYPTGSTTATRVYGQGGDFTTGIADKGGLSADSLHQPQGVAADSTGVYIADSLNSRVLFYPGTSTTASRVYGQNGSFNTGIANNGGLSANSLNLPFGLAVNKSGVYIADTFNFRVLFYSGSSTTASRVYGQNGSFTTAIDSAIVNGAVNANSLSTPFGVALDSTAVYISDSDNNRVLFYSNLSTTATKVYGQGGSFTTRTANKGGLSKDSLERPGGIGAFDSGLYVADTLNNRVVYYPRNSTSGNSVYGQPNFTTNTFVNNTPSAKSLFNPLAVAVNRSGVYVIDDVNRAVVYPPHSATANQVYGQIGDFTTGIANK